MNSLDSPTIKLDNFEGPLDFLWYLIQKNDIDIYAIPLKKITEQYLENLKEITRLNVDTGAEFIHIAACLHFFKTRMLLPKHEQEQPVEEIDPQFEIIHQLLDYCRFKQSAQELTQREQKQRAFYFRGIEKEHVQKNLLGIDHLCLEDLMVLFQQVLVKASVSKGHVYEDVWKVSDKILALRQSLQHLQKMPFELLFAIDTCREELIVTFLAVLELMKMGEIIILKEASTHAVIIAKTSLLTDKNDG